MTKARMGRLDGQVALVTGASRGIGRGVAQCLAKEGADVIVNYRSHPDEAHVVVQEIERLGREALAIGADISDRHAVADMVTQAVARFGHVDIVVANAAYSIREPVLDASWEGVQRTIAVTQFGTFHTCQLAAQQMAKQIAGGRAGGNIVIMSSIVEEVCPGGLAAYNMAKAAVNRLGITMAKELAPLGIRVNLVNPGWIDTPGERAFASEEMIQSAGPTIPLGRLGTPEDIGKAVAFLVSDDASYVTGTMLRVDGGHTLGSRRD